MKTYMIKSPYAYNMRVAHHAEREYFAAMRASHNSARMLLPHAEEAIVNNILEQVMRDNPEAKMGEVRDEICAVVDDEVYSFQY